MNITASDLNALPTGSAVIARHKRYKDTAVFVRTDDTKRMGDDGFSLSHAWMSPTYTLDRTAEELVEESSSLRVIWNADNEGDLP